MAVPRPGTLGHFPNFSAPAVLAVGRGFPTPASNHPSCRTPRPIPLSDLVVLGGSWSRARCDGRDKVGDFAQLGRREPPDKSPNRLRAQAEQGRHGIGKRLSPFPLCIGTELLRFGWCNRWGQVWRSAIKNGLDLLLLGVVILDLGLFGFLLGHHLPDEQAGALVGVWLTLQKRGHCFFVPSLAPAVQLRQLHK